MKKNILKIIRLFTGLFLYSVGIVMTINANLGLGPWDVFHQGLSIQTGITIGQASIFFGFILIIMNSFFGEKLGWGTICNMLFIGIFIDVLMINELIPSFENPVLSALMMFLGMFIIGVASYYYIGAGLGSGPRDGLMVALTKKTKKPVGIIRNIIELCALTVGYFLGGFVGIGTLIIALSIGFFVQFAFKLFKFDVSVVEHRFIDEDIKWLKEKLLFKGNESKEEMK